MRYAKIKWHDISNGPGVRASLFVSGCTHGCPGCFNEIAWDFNYGDKWTSEIEQKFIDHLKKPEILGVNILGGEPLQQDETLTKLLTRIRTEVNKPIWLWTGFVLDDIIKTSCSTHSNKRAILYQCDVVVDGLFLEAEKDLKLKYRGSKNQRVIDIQTSIKNAALASGYPVLMSEYLVKLEGF